jgi:hypothetical protein
VSDDATADPSDDVASRSDAWTDLGLTLPVFLVYHLGVVFLPARNAADMLTGELRALASHSLLGYAGLTVAIGGAFVLVLSILGRGRALEPKRFLLLAVEGALYAALMRAAAAWAVGTMPLAVGAEPPAAFSGLVMSLGAGFYEELVFRVALFGGGAWLIKLFFGRLPGLLLVVGWGLACAGAFAGWHYVGPYGDPWDAKSFVFRMTCGAVLTLIYAVRGFAPAVWTHALYDVWVLCLTPP